LLPRQEVVQNDAGFLPHEGENVEVEERPGNTLPSRTAGWEARMPLPDIAATTNSVAGGRLWMVDVDG